MSNRRDQSGKAIGVDGSGQPSVSNAAHRRLLIRSSSSRTSHRGRLRLRLEPLETRRLLAGLNVSVFVDHDHSQDFNPAADAVAPGRLVFIDADRDGSYSDGEVIALTDRNGVARFDDLPKGEYWVGLHSAGAERQVTSTGVDSVAAQVQETDSRFLIADSGLKNVWSISSDATLQRVGMDNSSEELPQKLDSLPTSVVRRNDRTAIILFDAAASQPLAELDLQTGHVTTLAIESLPDDVRIEQIVVSRDKLLALLSSKSGGQIASAEIVDGAAVFGQTFRTNAYRLAASPDSGILVAAEHTNGQHTVSELAINDRFARISSAALSDRAIDLAISSDGMQVAVATERSGVEAFGLTDLGIELQAILSEATTPVDLSSADGHLATGRTGESGRVLLWDTDSWLQVGRTQIPAGEMANTSILRDRSGERLVAGNTMGAYSADLRRPLTQRVSVGEEGGGVSFGVRTTRENSAPSVQDLPIRTLAEDASDVWDLSAADSFFDADGDRLWFTLADGPEHGNLTVELDGSWSYQPTGNFHGPDSAVLRVHDGLSSTEFVVHLNVLPVNDPPIGMTVEADVLREDAPEDLHFGYVTIIDVDTDATYRVTTSDSRFTVVDGRLYLSRSDLDFESGATIVFDVYASDLADPSVVITTPATITLADVNEPPTGLRLVHASVDENSAGSVVGAVDVEDPDASNDFDFTVSDPRFEVSEGQLKLLAGEALDHESEPTIAVRIEATDRSDPNHRVSETVTVSVTNRNDPPTGIVLSRTVIEAEVPGSSVGTVRVEDADGENYRFRVSDDRFLVEGNVLKLRHDRAIVHSQERTVPLTITATSINGDQLTRDFTLQVQQYTPYQNPVLPHDVNGDGVVTPLDVLILINHLNREGIGGSGDVGGGGDGEPGVAGYPDVNGDNRITPLDVLLIINYLNSTRDGSGEDSALASDFGSDSDFVSDSDLGSASTPTKLRYGDPNNTESSLEQEPFGFEAVYGPQLPRDFFADLERQRREAARELDAELESLLNQLAK